MPTRLFASDREPVRVISSLAHKAKCFKARPVCVAQDPAKMPADETASVPRLPHVPALDGLRALAVLCVLFYHAGPRWMPGGFLGVEVFFVISGYLITSLLLAEWSERGDVDLKAFWLRRARRLLPAVVLLLLGVVAFSVAFLPAEVAQLRGDVLSAAAYVNNWYQLFDHKSYFETVGRPSLLRHLWSLSVEEQFYLVWPVLFSLLMWRRPRQALWVVLAGALASAVWMAVLYQPDMDPSRPYYGTDTRAGGLLLGTALAFVCPPGRPVGRMGSRTLDAAGFCALGVLTACILCVNEFQTFLYCGGFTLIGLTTAGLIAVAVHPRACLVPRALSGSLLRWLGLRSYGIYLWHFPVFMVTRPQLDLPLDGAPLLLMRFALTMTFAALSYRFVETPIRQGALAEAWVVWRKSGDHGKRAIGLRWATAMLSLAAAISILGVCLLKAQPPTPPDYLSVPLAGEPAATTSTCLAAQSAVLPAAASPTAGTETPVLNTECGGSITAIGDSVMRGADSQMKRTLGTNVLVDAEQGRMPWNAPTILRKLREAGKINPIVIIHIGDNGVFTRRVFDKIMEELKDARGVLIVNLKVPRNWEEPNNTMLAEATQRYPNVVLVDWHGASENHPEIFWKDGYHLRPEGAKRYAELIAKAVAGLSRGESGQEALAHDRRMFTVAERKATMAAN